MRGAWMAAALLLGGVAGCTAPISRDDIDSLPLVGHHARHLRPGEPATFTVDPRFSAEERGALDASAVDARADGLLVTFVAIGGEGSITRGRPDFGRAYGPDEHASFSADLFSIWVDADDASLRSPGAIRAAVHAVLVSLSESGR